MQARAERLDRSPDALAVDREGRLRLRVDGDERQRRLQARDEAEPVQADALGLEPFAQPPPQASSPAPPASSTSAPRRAAATATLATAPPKCGTNAGLGEPGDRGLADEVDERLTEAERGHAQESTTCYPPRAWRSRRRRRGTGLDGQPPLARGAVAEGASDVYVHGVPTNGSLWIPFLARTGGIAPDLPGFGRSGKRGDLDFTMEGYGRWIERFLEWRGVDRFNLVVQDWGGVGLGPPSASPIASSASSSSTRSRCCRATAGIASPARGGPADSASSP